MSVYSNMYMNWAVAAAVAFRCPRNVRLVLDDDTEVACRCRWLGLTEDHREAWAATPADGRPVQVSRIAGVAAELEAPWIRTLLEIEGVTDGFVCPDCARVSHNPHDLREGYCGACHKFTGRPVR